jgi:hypothetical protein
MQFSQHWFSAHTPNAICWYAVSLLLPHALSIMKLTFLDGTQWYLKTHRLGHHLFHGWRNPCTKAWFELPAVAFAMKVIGHVALPCCADTPDTFGQDDWLAIVFFSHCTLTPYRHSDKTNKNMQIATAAHIRVSKHPQSGFQLGRNFFPSRKELEQ